MEDSRRCSSCSRGPQPLDQFINSGGKELKTCIKCREKDKSRVITEERRAAKNKLQSEKKYYKEWREKKRAENEQDFKTHNNEVHKKWKESNHEHASTWSRTSVNTRLDSIKRSAQKRGITWELDDESAKKMLVRPCVYCNFINLSVRVNGIDRMDSRGPYSERNCVPCCKDCNYMKCNYDPKTFIERCKKISECSYTFPDDIQQCLENRFALSNFPTQSGTDTQHQGHRSEESEPCLHYQQ
jgi:hypothetical protein